MRIGTVTDLYISDAAKEIVRLWQKMPRDNGNLLPKRLALDIDSLPETIAPHFSMLCRLDESVATVIHCGSAINDFLGIDVSGQNILEYRSGEQKELEKSHYNALVSQPCAGFLSRSTSSITGAKAFFNTIQLPMLDYKDNACYFMGAVSITGRNLPFEDDRIHAFNATKVVDQAFIDIGAGTPTLNR